MTMDELKAKALRMTQGFPAGGKEVGTAVLAPIAERDEASREHIALMNVSGALVDSGEVVPDDEYLYGEIVRKITARAEAAEAKLAEAERERASAARNSRAWFREKQRLAKKSAAAESREKALREQLADRDELLAQFLQADDEEDRRTYSAALAAAREALVGLSSCHTKSGPCWCNGNDKGGHSEACEEARAALAAGKEGT